MMGGSALLTVVGGVLGGLLAGSLFVRHDRHGAARTAGRAGLLVAHLQARMEAELEAEPAVLRCWACL